MKAFTTTLLASAACVLAATGTAQAALSIVAIQGGAPTGVTLDNLDWLAVNPVDTAPPNATGGVSPQSGVTVTFEPNAGAALGAVGGQFAAPTLSGNNGNGFGNPIGTNQPNGVNTTPYITSGSTGAQGFSAASVTIELPDNGGLDYTYFGLLWGSIDAYNTLQFFDGGNLVGTLTGADVTASPNGDQGVAGTRYVNIVSTLKFDTVVATSSQFAFEFDNIAFNPTFPVPAPAALGLFGVGLLGLALARRRR